MRIENLQTIRETARAFIRQIDEHKIFAFRGKMGAGKTTFIKAVCEELGVKDTVNSPTFAIINEYFSATLGEPIYHFDFYRIENPDDAVRIGIEDYFTSGFLCFIEWAEKIENLLPENVVVVNIEETADGTREIQF
jgi:tRNA threonylcarbamoyladenosine biosynthesis protein TsaE